jgi:peptidyl-prolyl cis-trans isomerase C
MRISRFLFVLGAAGLLAACTKPADDAAKGADAAGPAAATTTAATIATVNGKKLSGELYDTFVQAVTGGQMQEPLTDEQKTQLVDQLVNMTLAAQAAEKEGLQKDPKVSARIELLRTQILAEAASEKYIKAHPVSETEMKAEYDAQIASMPKEYKARHILVDKQETAESIIRELQAGGDFSKLAKAESKDSSAQSGGDLGWFSPQTMVKPFADAVMALEKGKYTTTPVQSEFGYHVIILDDVRSPEAPKFEEVKPQVEMFVQRKKLQEYLDGLRKTAQIQK